MFAGLTTSFLMGANHNEASFAGNADYRPETFISCRDEHLRAHDLDPIPSCLAEHDDDLVGFLLARRCREESVGFVDLLGVHPDRRRRGLATIDAQDHVRPLCGGGAARGTTRGRVRQPAGTDPL
jgi:Acetyltransferase (GNAT) family